MVDVAEAFSGLDLGVHRTSGKYVCQLVSGVYIHAGD